MTADIEIRAQRPFYLKGKVIEAGAVVSVQAVDAAFVVGTTRAEYVRPGDRERVIAAMREADAKACPDVPNRSDAWIRRF